MKKSIHMSILWLLGLMLPAAVAAEVLFVGQHPAYEKQLVRRIAQWESQSAATALDSVRVWFRDNGYLDAEVVRADTLWQLTAGKQVQLCLVTRVDNSTTVLDEPFPFGQESLRVAIDRILDSLRERGYYYARASLSTIRRDSNCVRVEIAATAGPQLEVERIMPGGLTRSRPEGVRRYLSIQEGDLLTDKLLARLQDEATAISYLDYLPPVDVRPRPGFAQADLGLAFREQSLLTLFGGGGVLPSDDNMVIWNLDITVNNFFGLGRRVSLYSERRSRARQALRIKYVRPNFLFGVGEVALGVATRDFRDDFYEFEVTGQQRGRFGQRLVSGLELSWKRVDIANSLDGYVAYAAEFSISRQQVDRRMYPLSGSRLDVGIGYRHRRYASVDSLIRPDGSVFNETRSRIMLEFMQPFLGAMGGRIQLRYVGVETGESQPPAAELELIGGPGSLRGYRNDQFVAQRAGMFTLEPRLSGDGVMLFAFYDAAYFSWRENSTEFAKTFRWSVGFGLNLFDPQRGLTLSLGWADDVKFDQARLSLEFHSGV